MSGTRPRVSDLTPEELEILAMEHVASVFTELRAACAVVRERCHPVSLVKRHPLVAAGLAAAAGFVLVRYLRRTPAGSPGQRAAAPGLPTARARSKESSSAKPRRRGAWATPRGMTCEGLSMMPTTSGGR